MQQVAEDAANGQAAGAEDGGGRLEGQTSTTGLDGLAGAKREQR